MRELFTEFGKLKNVMINYNESGKSHGTADIIFKNNDDAVKAYKKYNGVPLDGRPMKIDVVAASPATASVKTRLGPSPSSVRGGAAGAVKRGGIAGRFRGNRGGRISRGGRGSRGRGRGSK